MVVKKAKIKPNIKKYLKKALFKVIKLEKEEKTKHKTKIQ